MTLNLPFLIYDSAIFRQKYRQSIISHFSIRKLYVLGPNQKKNASLYTYTPTQAKTLKQMQRDNGR